MHSDDARGAQGVVGYQDYLIGQIGLSSKTVTTYVAKMEAAQAWCLREGESLYSMPAHRVADMAVDVVPNSASSRRQLRTALMHYWTMVGRHDPPTKAVRVPKKPPGRCRALEPYEARDLVKHAIGWHPEGLAVLMGMYLALRAGEIASARWTSINDGVMTVMGKGDRTRHLPVHPVLGSELEFARRRSRYEWMFPGSRGRSHVTEATVWGWVRKVAGEIGIDGMQTHQLRHTCLASMNDATGDLRATQEFAGHARPETTAIYTRVTRQRLTDAVMALDYL